VEGLTLRHCEAATQGPFEFDWHFTERARPYDVGFLHILRRLAFADSLEAMPIHACAISLHVRNRHTLVTMRQVLLVFPWPALGMIAGLLNRPKH
jgi:hypothetical protein